ncbi:MAG: PEGA domain-containing protein [Myxococcales bacterium]
MSLEVSKLHGRGRLLAILLCLGCLAIAQRTRADAVSVEDMARASEHFDRGNGFVEGGNFAAAAVEFEQAHALSHDDAVLHNLGMAYIVLYRPLEAISALSRYLEHEGERLSPDERESLVRLIAEQKQRTGTLSLQVEPSAAQVRLDGRDLGASPLAPITLALGAHQLEVSCAGHVRELRTLVLTEAQTDLKVTLRAESFAAPLDAASVAPQPTPEPALVPAAKKPASAQAQARASQQDARLQRTGIVTLAAGVGAGVAALTVYLISNGRFDTWQKQQHQIDALAHAAGQMPANASVDDPLVAMQKDNDNLLRSVWRMDHAAVALSILGGGLALSGSMLLWKTKRRRDARSLTLRVAPMGTRLAIRAHF